MMMIIIIICTSGHHTHTIVKYYKVQFFIYNDVLIAVAEGTAHLSRLLLATPRRHYKSQGAAAALSAVYYYARVQGDRRSSDYIFFNFFLDFQHFRFVLF